MQVFHTTWAHAFSAMTLPMVSNQSLTDAAESPRTKGYSCWLGAVCSEITKAYHDKVKKSQCCTVSQQKYFGCSFAEIRQVIEVVDASRKLELSLQRRLKKKANTEGEL